ncbi:MAG: glycerophosphodiester phosphodiesterase [Thalassotalea sp.]
MLVIAHRGASGEYPENSLLAIKKALEQGADGIEIDLQYHQASGEFIIFHDRNLQHLTEKTGSINNYSLTQLLTTSIGQGQCITTLTQVIEIMPADKILNLELKVRSCQQTLIHTLMAALTEQLSNAVNSRRITWSTLHISSFNHHVVQHCQTLLPKVSIGALIAHSPLDYAKFSEQMALTSVNQEVDHLNHEIVADIHQHGLACWVFTVDDIEDIQRCIALNVDAIFTNYPARTKAIIAGAK